MMNLVPSMTISDVSLFLYPRVYRISELAINSNEPNFALPKQIRASIEYFQNNEAYFIENGLVAFIWLGIDICQEWLFNVFNVHTLSHLDVEKVIKNFKILKNN